MICPQNLSIVSPESKKEEGGIDLKVLKFRKIAPDFLTLLTDESSITGTEQSLKTSSFLLIVPHNSCVGPKNHTLGLRREHSCVWSHRWKVSDETFEMIFSEQQIQMPEGQVDENRGQRGTDCGGTGNQRACRLPKGAEVTWHQPMTAVWENEPKVSKSSDFSFFF